MKTLEDSADKETRWVAAATFRSTKGPRYRVGEFNFDGNKVVKSEFLRPIFKLKTASGTPRRTIRKGLEKAREIYGAGGYFEFTGYPDSRRPIAGAREGADRRPGGADRQRDDADAGRRAVLRQPHHLRRQHHDARQRRSAARCGSSKAASFNTEALKFSVKRLNQLGYFKPLESGQGVDVQKTPSEKNKVDVTLKLEEQNRNQLTFGAGVSQFEGFFGQLSFQTANFLGRGEIADAVAAGRLAVGELLSSRSPSRSCSIATSPAASTCIGARFRYIDQFTQDVDRRQLTTGFPLAGFSRMFFTYSYERYAVSDLNPIY